MQLDACDELDGHSSEFIGAFLVTQSSDVCPVVGIHKQPKNALETTNLFGNSGEEIAVSFEHFRAK